MTKLLSMAGTLLAVFAHGAAADSTAQRYPTLDLGARVGGYGFKREGDDRIGRGWTECRMNGLGVFASRAFTRLLFVEAGLDMYATQSFPLQPNAMDLPIDRMSGLASIAGGARTSITSWLRGYVQLGGGIEVTRVSVPYGDDKIRDTKVMPEGFLGLGLDVRVARQTYFGASFRALMMGNFDYTRAQLEEKQEWGFGSPAPAVVFDASLDFATQAQFYVRRDL